MKDKVITLEIDSGDERYQVADILIGNGYKVWQVKKCTRDMGGMAGSEYEYYLQAEKMANTEAVK